MADSKVVIINDEDFANEVLNSETLTVVDFWAEWCGPCRAVTPIMDKLSEEYAGKVKICKLNVDDNDTVPGQFGIMSIPTVLFFKGGELLASKVGALRYDGYKQIIESLM
ncbi:MAG: thioredoxin [Eubacteriaceae bacterium]|nr:thioredoxin [Eubacteriaceae bacterium]